MKKIAYLILLLVGFSSYGQQYQQKYLEGKELYRNGKYRLAMETFRPMAQTSETHNLSEYASFYFALAAYQDGQVYVARDMFKQIASRFRNWRKIDEVNLWLTQIYFELGQYESALNYFNELVSIQIVKKGRELKQYHLHQIDSIEILYELHEQFPKDKVIAAALVNKIENQPLADKDVGLMETLVNNFDLDRTQYNVLDYSQNVKKEEYLIGVLLPFMFDDLENTRQILRNNLVTSLYEGMLIAEEELTQRGQNIRLIPYDTRRNEDATVRLINKPEMGSMDLLVGPLYPGPSKVASQFSYDQRINMVNPLSSNSEVIGNNPYSFLFEPSTETQAKRTAEYAKRYSENKTAVILYEDNDRDSLFAHVYKRELEKDSFNVVWFRKFTEENARQIIDTLTALYESEIPEEMLDSLLDIEDYPMQLRRKENPDDPDEYYEELLVIAPDSIGHIMTSSNKVVLAANSLSTVNIRGDSIPLIGREEWLEHASVGFDQIEQLDVSLIAPTFYDENSVSYRILRDKVIENFKTAPNKYHVIGYELIQYFGSAMHLHGKYFQAGVRGSYQWDGRILQGIRYDTNNDNQLVPIIKFEDAQLKRVDNLTSHNDN